MSEGEQKILRGQEETGWSFFNSTRGTPDSSPVPLSKEKGNLGQKEIAMSESGKKKTLKN